MSGWRWARSSHRLGDGPVAATRGIVRVGIPRTPAQPEQLHGRAANGRHRGFIDEQAETGGARAAAEFSRIIEEIVVPFAQVNSVPSPHPPGDRDRGAQIAEGEVDQVAGKEHEIGVEVVRRRDDAVEHFATRELPDVEIGDVSDRHPIQRRRQSRQREGHATDAKVFDLPKRDARRSQRGNRRDRRAEQPGEFPASDRRRVRDGRFLLAMACLA